MDGVGRSSQSGDGGAADDTGRSDQSAGIAPERVSARTTRTPNRRARRWAFVTKNRFKNLSAPLELPGAELAEIPVIGPIVLVIMGLILILVVGLLIGGFLLAFVELLLIAALALVGWAWAWMRGHPKMVVLEVDDQRWVRPDGPEVDAVADARQVRQGTDPNLLGYEPLR